MSSSLLVIIAALFFICNCMHPERIRYHVFKDLNNIDSTCIEQAEETIASLEQGGTLRELNTRSLKLAFEWMLHERNVKAINVMMVTIQYTDEDAIDLEALARWAVETKLYAIFGKILGLRNTYAFTEVLSSFIRNNDSASFVTQLGSFDIHALPTLFVLSMQHGNLKSCFEDPLIPI